MKTHRLREADGVSRRRAPVLQTLGLIVLVCAGASPATARSTLPASSYSAPAVIDDLAMEEAFVRGLRAGEGMGGLTGRAASEAVRAAEGKKVRIAAEEGTVAPLDQASWKQSVVVIGSISKCEECPEWHMDSVSAGWVMTPDGLIATNYHVLEDEEAERLGVMTADGRVFPIKEVVAADRHGDAALLRLEANGESWKWLPLASQTEPGEEARILSHPDGRFYSLSTGIVSRVHRAPAEENGEPRVWTTVTADFGAGSSGAPVLNGRGEVIGMVSSTAVLLADPEEGKQPAAEDVQMVFKDCVSLQTIRGLLE